MTCKHPVGQVVVDYSPDSGDTVLLRTGDHAWEGCLVAEDRETHQIRQITRYLCRVCGRRWSEVMVLPGEYGAGDADLRKPASLPPETSGPNE